MACIASVAFVRVASGSAVVGFVFFATAAIMRELPCPIWSAKARRFAAPGTCAVYSLGTQPPSLDRAAGGALIDRRTLPFLPLQAPPPASAKPRLRGRPCARHRLIAY